MHSLPDRLGRIGVPKRYIEATLDDFQPRPGTAAAVNAVRRWAMEPLTDRGVLLSGGVGVGKSHLLAGALRERMENRGLQGAAWVNVPIFLDAMRQAIRYTDAKVMDQFENLRDFATVVVLDDLGKERATDWATERLYVLVESRYGRKLPTLVSSNRDLNELDALGYGALVSRLQETCDVVLMAAQDYRPAKGAR